MPGAADDPIEVRRRRRSGYGRRKGAGGTPEDPAIVGAVAALVAGGEVVVPIEGVYAIDDVVAAYEHFEKRHLRGKVILRVRD